MMGWRRGRGSREEEEDGQWSIELKKEMQYKIV
jgi:hypothetical protein